MRNVVIPPLPPRIYVLDYGYAEEECVMVMDRAGGVYGRDTPLCQPKSETASGYSYRVLDQIRCVWCFVFRPARGWTRHGHAWSVACGCQTGYHLLGCYGFLGAAQLCLRRDVGMKGIKRRRCNCDADG